MRWQDALTGAARTDFTRWLTEQRDEAARRLRYAKDLAAVTVEQVRLDLLDELERELTQDERNAAADAAYRERLRGDHPSDSS